MRDATVGRLVAIAAWALLVPAVVATPVHAASAPAAPAVAVIVQHDPGASGAAADAVAATGGRVRQRFEALDALAARVPADRLGDLAGAGHVRLVTPDRSVRLAADKWRADGGYDSTLSSVVMTTGAIAVWGKQDPAGVKVTGKGIGVALIDSGVAPVKGLNGAGKVVNGPDLSFESQAGNLRYLDTFGHGTHMAGIIAGQDPPLAQDQTGTPFTGMAPDATLVSLKVATADGATDVSQVIAAIDWVVAHRNDPGLNIRVLNLSFGTDSVQDPRFDPLSHAVEAAWRKGIVVVVAVGNDGPTATRLSMPAVNPYVLAVGASDGLGTFTKTDDVVASFSTRGNTTRRPDLVAPGRSVISLRNPNSFIDVNYPTGLVSGDADGRFFRGSGSSQATAVVSGAAALLLQQRPTLTPDQVKKLLMSTADAMPAADPVARGAGQLNVLNASNTATPKFVQNFPASQGTGSLEQSRGSAHVSDPSTGIDLVGERDIMGQPWNPGAWAPACTAGTAWSGGTWNGRTWTGTAWTGTSWTSRTWSGSTWTGTTWTGSTWTSRTWSDATWTGTSWTSRTWSGQTWSSRTWSGGAWS